MIAKACLIIWEELPMFNKTAIECVDSLIRQITSSNKPFGGKIILGLGDFRQVASVVTNI